MGDDDKLAALEARPWALTSGELVSLLDDLQSLAVQVEAARLAAIGEFDARGLYRDDGATSTRVWLRNRYRIAITTASRLVRLAAAVDAAPAAVGEAVAAGKINSDQAASITRSMERLPRDVGAQVRDDTAAALVGYSGELDPTQLDVVGDRILHLVAPEIAEEADRRALERDEERARESRAFTMVPDPVRGGVRLHGRLTAEAAAVVGAAIDPLCKPVPGDERVAAQRRADALVEVCRLALGTTDLPRNGGDRPQVVVNVDFDVLKQELGAGTLDDGTRVTPETVRRIACDCRLIPAVLDSAGQPLDLGRSVRLVKGPLRQALVARDRGCAFPRCDRGPRWCEGHHLRHWTAGGPTSLANTVLLCGAHHGEVHRPGGWAVVMAADGLPSFIPPPHIDPDQRPRRNHGGHRRRRSPT